jgi:hypothetical protein
VVGFTLRPLYPRGKTKCQWWASRSGHFTRTERLKVSGGLHAPAALPAGKDKRSVVSFTLRPLYQQGNTKGQWWASYPGRLTGREATTPPPGNPPDMGLGWPHSRAGPYGKEENILSLPTIEARLLISPARSLVAIPAQPVTSRVLITHFLI